MVCALPVFPAKSMPCKWALPAVPSGVGTFAMASVMMSQFLGSMGTLTTSGVSAAGSRLAGIWLGNATCGRRKTPSLVMPPLARVPFLLEVANLPLFRGHDAAYFLRQINIGFLAQSECGGILGDAINPQLLRQGVEKYVARLINRLADLHRAMGAVLGGDPALE